MTSADSGFDLFDLGDFGQEEPARKPEDKILAMFREAFPNAALYERSCRLPLACLALSRDPVPAEELIYIFSWVDDRFESFAREIFFIADMVTDRTGRTALAIRDPQVCAWLFTSAAGPYQADEREAAKKMSDAFYEIFILKRRELTPYEALYLPLCLKKVSTTESRKMLDSLSDSPTYVYSLLVCGDDARLTGNTDLASRFYLQALETSSELTAKKRTSENAAASIDAMRRTAQMYLDTNRDKEALVLLRSAAKLAVSGMEGTLSDSLLTTLEEDLLVLAGRFEVLGDPETADSCYTEIITLARDRAGKSRENAVHFAGHLFVHAIFLLKNSLSRDRARDELLIARRILSASGGQADLLARIDKILASLG